MSEKTKIAPDPVSDLYIPEMRAAPTDTHEDCHFVASGGNPRDRFATQKRGNE